MAEFENLWVEPIYSIDEEAVQREREYCARWGDDFDESVFRGLNSEVITSLLDTIGARGDSPIMATLLYSAGVEKPVRSCDWLYGDRGIYTWGGKLGLRLYGVYIDGDALQRDSEPDALLLAQGESRKAYRGYKLVATDFWVNPGSDQAIKNERALRDQAQRTILTGNCYDSWFMFVEQDTVILEMDGNEGSTVEALGIQPDEYGGGAPRTAEFDRMNRLDEFSPYRKNSELIKNLQTLYAALKPEVEEIDGEGAELYELRLSEEEINALNRLQGLKGTDQITGLSIDREDRPPGSYGHIGKENPTRYYTNGWGDMTIIISVEREGVSTTYTLSVDMEGGRDSNLRKRLIETRRFTDQVAKAANHLLSLIEDPMEKELKLNEIDEFEYQALVKLIRDVQAVVTLT